MLISLEFIQRQWLQVLLSLKTTWQYSSQYMQPQCYGWAWSRDLITTLLEDRLTKENSLNGRKPIQHATGRSSLSPAVTTQVFCIHYEKQSLLWLAEYSH